MLLESISTSYEYNYRSVRYSSKPIHKRQGMVFISCHIPQMHSPKRHIDEIKTAAHGTANHGVSVKIRTKYEITAWNIFNIFLHYFRVQSLSLQPQTSHSSAIRTTRPLELLVNNVTRKVVCQPVAPLEPSQPWRAKGPLRYSGNEMVKAMGSRVLDLAVLRC